MFPVHYLSLAYSHANICQVAAEADGEVISFAGMVMNQSMGQIIIFEI